MVLHSITRNFFATLDFKIRSRTGFFGAPAIRRCLATSTDKQAMPSLRYYVSLKGQTTRENLSEYFGWGYFEKSFFSQKTQTMTPSASLKGARIRFNKDYDSTRTQL